MNRSDPQDIRTRLQQAGIWSKKRLGQHFLCDPAALAQIIAAAELEATDMVVEVGPGLGVLTEELLSRVERVVAFEYDPDMVEVLSSDFRGLQIVPGDVLKTAEGVISELVRYKVVANIPYQITTPLLRLFLEGALPLPERLVLLVQRELGQRLAARPGQPGRGYLSVLCQYLAEVDYIATVPPTSFWPSPQVDSAIVRLRSRPTGSRLLEPDQERAFLRFVRMLFTQPRKQLKNVLGGVRGLPAQEVGRRFVALGLRENLRAQEVTLEQWKELYGQF